MTSINEHNSLSDSLQLIGVSIGIPAMYHFATRDLRKPIKNLINRTINAGATVMIGTTIYYFGLGNPLVISAGLGAVTTLGLKLSNSLINQPTTTRAYQLNAYTNSVINGLMFDGSLPLKVAQSIFTAMGSATANMCINMFEGIRQRLR